MIKINFANSKAISTSTKNNLQMVFEEALRILNQNSLFEINLTCVGLSEMKDINNRLRGKDSATDVLSFPAFDFHVGEIVDLNESKYRTNVNFENGCFCLGDIVICKQIAKQQAKIYGHAIELEIIRLAVHSLLHCFGYDHILDNDYVVMHELEQKILNNCNIYVD